MLLALEALSQSRALSTGESDDSADAQALNDDSVLHVTGVWRRGVARREDLDGLI